MNPIDREGVRCKTAKAPSPFTLSPHSSGGKGAASEGGFALLITLLVVLLFVVLIFEIDFQARTDLRAAENFRDDLAAYYIAISGISAGKAILKDDKEGKTDPESPKWDYNEELWATPMPEIPVGEGVVSGQMKDESGKFNLNSLVIKNPNQPEQVDSWKRAQLKRLLDLLDIGSLGNTESIVDSTIDWIDANDNPENDGAENGTYRSLDPPYSAKNDWIDTLEEILYINGISMEIYEKIAPYLTVYPKDSGSPTQPNPNFGKININTADSIILQSIDQDITEEDANNLIAERPHKTPTEFYGKLPATTRTPSRNVSQDKFEVKSDIFSIEAYGTVRNTRKMIRAVWDRQNKKLLHFRVE